jgi:hypothetical protein
MCLIGHRKEIMNEEFTKEKLRNLVQVSDEVCEYILDNIDEKAMFTYLEETSKIKRKEYLTKAIPEFQAELTELSSITVGEPK